MMRRMILVLLMTFLVYGADEIVFAEYTNEADALQAQWMVEDILLTNQIDHQVEVIQDTGTGYYQVRSDPIPDPRERERIVRLVRHLLGLDTGRTAIHRRNGTQRLSQGKKARTSTSRPKRSPFYGAVALRAGYNNNIYDHTRIEKTHYGLYDIDNNTSIIGDVFLSTSAHIAHRNRWEGSPLFVNGSLNFSRISYQSHSDQNLQELSLKEGIGYTRGNHTLFVPLYASRLWYGTDPYRYAFGIKPEYFYTLNDRTELSASLDLLARRHIQAADRDWDTNHLQLTAGARYRTVSHATIRGDIGFIADRRVQGALSDVSANGLFASLRLMMPLWGDTYGNVGFRIDHRSFLDKNPNLPLRSDDKSTLNIGIVHPITRNLSVTFDYQHAENHSNINAYTYRHDTVMFGIKAHF